MSRRHSEDERVPVPRAFTELRADWAAGRESRFQRIRTGLNLLGSGADYHIRHEMQFLRAMEHARDMARNDTVVGAIVERCLRNIFQGGFGLDPQTGDEKLDEDLKADFLEWFENPAQVDVSGRFDGHALAEQAAWGTKVDGGAFVLPQNGQLQAVEYHRCRTPSNTRRNVVAGVLINERRRPLEYWFTKDDLNPLQSLSRVGDIEPYPAYDETGEELVWHIYDPKRFTQTRGVSAFAPVLDCLGMFEDINFANLVRAQASACFVLIRETPPGFSGGPTGRLGARRTEAVSDGTDRLIEELTPGTEIKGRPGETIKGFAPNVPNAEFFEHARFTLQLICACVNLPLISFMLDGRETNFSGWRGALDQAKIGWRRDQALFAHGFHRKAYRYHLRCRLAQRGAAVLRKLAAKLGEQFYRLRINRPRWPYIQPIQDIKAASLELEGLHISPRRQAQERGYDLVELTNETVADNRQRIVAAFVAAHKAEQEIKKTTEQKVRIDPAQVLWLNPKKPLALAEGVPAPAVPAPAAGGNGDGREATRQRGNEATRLRG
ncbi:MAG: phage portal protein [Phycisphaerae bacterium]|nr:phage portal protein [Phycisphaerae bacterium]